MESPILRAFTRRKEEEGEIMHAQHQADGGLGGVGGDEDEDGVDFEEGRHMKVALSAKGVCVSQLWESRKKRERFEHLLNKVINGKLMPAPTKYDLIKHKQKLRRYRQLVTRPTPILGTEEEEPWWQKTLRDTEQIFRTCRTSQLSLKPVRVILPMSESQPDVYQQASHVRKVSISEEDASTAELLTKVSSVAKKPRATESQQPIASRGRFDPYKHSTWTFQERKCFFTSSFIPPHQRNTPLHVRINSVDRDITLVKKVSAENVEQDV